MKYIFQFLVMLMWTAGVVLAKGFWSTVAAIFIWPWGWYLVIEFLLKTNGML